MQPRLAWNSLFRMHLVGVLPQPPNCWECRHIPLYPALYFEILITDLKKTKQNNRINADEGRELSLVRGRLSDGILLGKETETEKEEGNSSLGERTFQTDIAATMKADMVGASEGQGW